METVGHKLRTARLARDLTIEDVARATRMRPDRIADLEEDEFSSFPNVAYARSFLLLYAKYLEVDVSDFMHTLQAATRVTADDYDYLQNTPTKKPAKVRKSGPGSAWPLFVLVGVVVLGLFVAYLIKMGERLGLSEDQESAQEDPVILQEVIPNEEQDRVPIPTPTPTPTATPTPTPTATPTPEPTPEDGRVLDGLPVRKAEPIE